MPGRASHRYQTGLLVTVAGKRSGPNAPPPRRLALSDWERRGCLVRGDEVHGWHKGAASRWTIRILGGMLSPTRVRPIVGAEWEGYHARKQVARFFPVATWPGDRASTLCNLSDRFRHQLGEDVRLVATGCQLFAKRNRQVPVHKGIREQANAPCAGFRFAKGRHEPSPVFCLHRQSKSPGLSSNRRASSNNLLRAPALAPAVPGCFVLRIERIYPCDAFPSF
jgi:hypothetical protein